MPDEGYERLINALNRPSRLEELEQAITANDAEMQRITQERDALLAELIERNALIGRLSIELEMAREAGKLVTRALQNGTASD